MSTRKKPAESNASPPQRPPTAERNRKHVALTLSESLTARFRQLATDYGVKTREARRQAEALLGELLDSLEADFSTARMKTAQMEIENLRAELDARAEEFERMKAGKAAGAPGEATAQAGG